MKRLTTTSLLVLSLAIATILVACSSGGSDADIDAIATEAAGIEPQAAVSVKAEGLKFDTDTIVVRADTPVTITLDNQDGGSLHNIAVYRDEDGTGDVFKGELFSGEDTREYSFTSPPAGVYFFKCDAHPDMNGAFISR